MSVKGCKSKTVSERVGMSEKILIVDWKMDVKIYNENRM